MKRTNNDKHIDFIDLKKWPKNAKIIAWGLK